MSHVDVGVQHGKSHVNMAFFSQRCPHVNMAFFSQHGIDHVNMEHLFLGCTTEPQRCLGDQNRGRKG